ncbi:MAG TPA: trigger factor [Spirochaetota bacterium]|nr:trigger factor [Spirochaetota bacterium]HOM38737.1 trigger factor [Spirochaetota bacterium]HPQ49535.1 trigger factor [Spirochaetota bacterium]
MIETKIEKKDGYINVTCKVDKEYIKNLMEETTKEVQTSANIKGFRKGSAPIGMVKKIYGEHIKYSTLDKIIKNAFDKVVEENKIQPIRTPEIEGIDNIKDNEDLSFNLKIEVMPEIEEMPELEEIEAKEVVFNYDIDALVEKEIELIRESRAKIENVNEKPKEKDYVVVEYKIKDKDGKEIETNNNVFMINPKLKNYFLTKEFIGSEIGKKKEVKISVPDDYYREDIKGKDVILEFTIKEVRRIILPEIEEIIKEKFNSIDEFKKALKEKIEKGIEKQSKLETALNIYKEIASKSKFFISNTIILNQAQQDLTRKVNTLISSGKGIEEYLKENNLTQEGFIEEAKKEALENIKTYLIVEKLAEKFNIELTEEEKKNYLESIYDMEILNRENVKNYYESNKKAKDDIYNELRLLKLAELVISKAKINGKDKRELMKKEDK